MMDARTQLDARLTDVPGVEGMLVTVTPEDGSSCSGNVVPRFVTDRLVARSFASEPNYLMRKFQNSIIIIHCGVP